MSLRTEEWLQNLTYHNFLLLAFYSAIFTDIYFCLFFPQWEGGSFGLGKERGLCFMLHLVTVLPWLFWLAVSECSVTTPKFCLTFLDFLNFKIKEGGRRDFFFILQIKMKERATHERDKTFGLGKTVSSVAGRHSYHTATSYLSFSLFPNVLCHSKRNLSSDFPLSSLLASSPK